MYDGWAKAAYLVHERPSHCAAVIHPQIADKQDPQASTKQPACAPSKSAIVSASSLADMPHRRHRATATTTTEYTVAHRVSMVTMATMVRLGMVRLSGPGGRSRQASRPRTIPYNTYGATEGAGRRVGRPGHNVSHSIEILGSRFTTTQLLKACLIPPSSRALAPVPPSGLARPSFPAGTIPPSRFFVQNDPKPLGNTYLRRTTRRTSVVSTGPSTWFPGHSTGPSRRLSARSRP